MRIIRRRGAILVLLAVLAAALFGGEIAHASTLTIGESLRPSSSTITGRCDTSVTAVPGANRVTIGDVNLTASGTRTSCSGAQVKVWLRPAGSTAAATTATATVGAASVDVTVPATPTTTWLVAATIGGWPVVVNWTAASAPGSDAVFGGNAESSVTGLSWTVFDDRQVCVAVTVSTSSYSAVEWRAQVNMAAAPFFGDTDMSHYTLESSNGVVKKYVNTPSAGVVQFGGNEPANSYLSTNPGDAYPSTLVFTFCDRFLPLQPDVPSAYGVTTTETSRTTGTVDSGTNVKVCFASTVTANGSMPFYFGWQYSIDLTAAVDYVRSKTGATPIIVWDTPSNAISQSAASGSWVYTVKSASQGVLKETQRRTVGVCVQRW